MTKTCAISFFAIDDNFYLIRETTDDGKAFVLTDGGRLREVSPGYVMAMGTPVSREEFHEEAKSLRAKAQAPDIKSPFYQEIDDSMYLVVEDVEDYHTFVLTDKGGLRNVSSGYVLANGNPISEEDFYEEAKKICTGVQAPYIKKPFYGESEDAVYLLIEGEENYHAWVLTGTGKLKKVPPGYVLCNCSPISKEEFDEEVERIRAKVRAAAKRPDKKMNKADNKSGAAFPVANP